MTSKLLRHILLLLLVSGIAGAQVKIASYNLLGYPGTDTTTRNPYYRSVVTAINPDILVVQEMTSQAGVNGFLNGIMNYNGPNYSTGTFIDGPDTDNSIFFRTSIYTFISNTPIRTALRDINEFKLVHLPGHDTLRIYSVHLKASTGTANEISRGAEVDSLRKVTNALPLNSYFIVCGDYNIYRSGEPAYQKLVEITAGNNGNFYDPLSLVGTWNTSAYAPYHTQSTRVRAFGGGATGGLDDRFDMILYSTAIKNPGGLTYVSNSMTQFGNDGNHYNDSINKPPNAVVTQTVANALHYASDHLPVYALFSYPTGVNLVNAVVPSVFKLYQNYPNPYNNSTVIRFDLPNNAFVSLRLFNALGQVIETLVNNNLSAGSYSVNWNAAASPSGLYYYQVSLDGAVYTKRMLLVK